MEDSGNSAKEEEEEVLIKQPWTKTWGRYFLPFRFGQSKSEKEHLENCGFVQMLFFTWIIPLIRLGFQKNLDFEDLGEVSPELKADHTYLKIKEKLHKTKERKTSMLKIYWHLCSFKFIGAFAFYATGQVCHFLAAAVASKEFFDYLSLSESIKFEEGFKKIAFLLSMLILMSLFKQQALHLGYRLGCYAKSAFLGMIYNKCLKVKSTGFKSIGEFVNLCSNDASRVYECSIFIAPLIVAPLQIIGGSVFLALYFGKSSLVGSAILVLYLPVSILFGRLYARLRKTVIKHSDGRVKMVSEAISYVKLIKMYAWELPFLNRIFDLRKKEKKSIQMMSVVEATAFTFSYCLSFLGPVSTIITAVYIGEELTVSKTFTMLTVFALASNSMGIGQTGVRCFSEALVTFKRLQEFMDLEERGDDYDEPLDKENAVEIENSYFSWSGSSKLRRDKSKKDLGQDFALSKLTLNVKRKSLIGICGHVGMGKSSFLSALLNEMEHIEGRCRVSNSIAYVPQQPWIMNDTIRENVLFGLPYDKQRFDSACNACALDEDIVQMKSGDLTEIGERGVNLSGGQKQRLSLARAIYSDQNMYLLDDPLSAVDVHVGIHIFENCIQKALKDKTVIMVTHHLQYLKDCDYVIFMKEGHFHEQGLYSELMSSDQEFAADIKKYTKEHEHDDEVEEEEQLVRSSSNSSKVLLEEEEDKKEEDVIESESKEDHELIKDGRLTKREEKSKGAVTLNTYLTFFGYCGGFVATFLVFFTNVGGVCLQITSDYWLSYWIKNMYSNSPISSSSSTSNNTNTTTNIPGQQQSTQYYVLIYCILATCMVLATFASSFITIAILLRGSTILHNRVFKVLFEAPMSFFESTPSGRILNCLSKDVDEIDSYLPNKMINAIRFFSRAFGYLFFIGIAIPWFLIPFFFICLGFVFLNHIFRKVIREVKRIENVTRSPVLSHLSTTLQGLSSIRTYGREKHFTRVFREHLDRNINALFYFGASQRWLGVNVDFVGHVSTLMTGIIVLLLKDHIPPAIGALCISYNIQSTGKFQFAFRLFAEVEARFTSVERLLHYIRTVKPEGKFETTHQGDGWPKQGTIDFESVSARYREKLPLVLKEVTISIKDREKIGIVGRTGAGKSSIGAVLYRLVNTESGTIRIGGLDIKEIGLYNLRRKLTIIPQDPVLFIGSIKYNLDPFHEFNDEELWDALEKAHIKDMVSGMPNKMDSEVLENGSNFSVGERQLICLARAALRRTKILFLDEATASIDAKSDSKIQETIKESFSNCTILTIAHRLNTIMHCDRILVMDDGKVVEFDSPSELLSRESKFNEIAKAAKISLSVEPSR